jgi:hypothetical protein
MASALGYAFDLSADAYFRSLLLAPKEDDPMASYKFEAVKIQNLANQRPAGKLSAIAAASLGPGCPSER